MAPIPALAGRSLLVVDVELVALPAGTDKPPLADLALGFDIVGRDEPWLGSSVEPAPFATSQSLSAGVHLHWQLPPGLTRGAAVYTLDRTSAAQVLETASLPVAAAVGALLPLSADTRGALADALIAADVPARVAEHLATAAASSTTFPAAPNRWLVQRWTAPAATAPDASWVLESDRLWSGRLASNDPCLAQNRLSPFVLMLPQDRSGIRRGTPIARRLGLVFQADSWTESAARVERLAPFTAVGYGHPAFAGALPHCYNVFGLLDPLPAQNANVSYTVLGWYSDPALDPTADAASLGFTVPENTAPERTVLRARTRNVAWQATTPSRTTSALQATVGATTYDAVAMALASGATDVVAAHGFLEVLQLGLIAHLNQATSGVPRTWDDAIRASEFGATPGGTAWTVKPVATDGDHRERAEAVPQELLAGLDALGDAQARLDRARLALSSARGQLFADWCLFLATAVAGKIEDGQRVDADGVRNTGRLRLAAGIDTVAAAESTAATALALRDAERDELLRNMTSLGFAGSHVLSSGPAPPYLHPIDPVLLLSGDDVAPAALFTAGSSVLTLDAALAQDAEAPAWAMPWRPVLLQWQAQYQPCDSTGTPDPAAVVQTLSGTTSLHAEPLAPLVAEAGGELPNLTAPAVTQSQALGGLTAALLGRRQSIELPVLDPNAADAADYRLALDVAAAIGAEARSGVVPVSAMFAPVREARLTVTRLWIIDSFGRPLAAYNVQGGATTSDGSLPGQGQSVTAVTPSLGLGLPSGAPPATPTPAFLSRRIVQPARLAARWQPGTPLNADLADPLSDTAANPVFGWLLVNRLDRALAFYSADGIPLGSLATDGLLWQSAPGPLFGKPWQEVVPPGPLSEFVGGLVAAIGEDADRTYLNALISAIDDSAGTSLPTAHGEHPGLSLLIGRPLAIVRAALDLELAGPPAIEQSAARFAKDPATDAQAIGDIATLTVPVTVGLRGLLDDGLVGYFLDRGAGGAAPGPGAFFAAPAADDTSPPPAWTSGAGAGVFSPQPSDTGVTVAGAAVRLTMLIDPRSPVHLDAGLLPLVRLQLAPEMYTPVLEAMSVTFTVGPIISPRDTSEGVRLPLPDEPGFRWSLGLRTGADWNFLATRPVQEAMTALTERQQLYEGWLRLDPDSDGTSA